MIWITETKFKIMMPFCGLNYGNIKIKNYDYYLRSLNTGLHDIFIENVSPLIRSGCYETVIFKDVKRIDLKTRCKKVDSGYFLLSENK